MATAIRLFKNPSIISLLDHMGSGFFHALTLALLYRILPTNDIGHWVLYFSLVTVFEFIRYGMTTIPLVRFLAAEVSKKEKMAIMGSSWLVAIIYTLVIAVVISLIGLFIDPSNSYKLFFKWYPLYSVCVLPMHYCTARFQSQFRFISILFYRQLSILPLLSYVGFSTYHAIEINVTQVVLVHLFTVTFASVWAICFLSTGFSYLRSARKKIIKKIVGFGKFTSLSGMVNHALRNTDLLLIGLLMSSKELVVYSIPMKLIDIFEIMLAGLTAVAFPKMSACKDKHELARLFYFNVGVALVTLIPVLCICYWQADMFVALLAGNTYADDNQTTALFRVFLLYTGFLAVLRFSDVCIDSLNKPKYNFRKSYIMIGLNIIGDIIAIYIFDSLTGVAVVTFINILIGIYLSFLYLKRISDITFLGLIGFWVDFMKSHKQSIFS